MTSVVDRDRRRVLGALACLLPLVACASTRGAATPERRPPTGAVPREVAEVGRRYLAIAPDEADPEVLRDALGLVDDEPESAMLERIDQKLRAEIDAGDLVEIAGWQLARTECRLYALVSLS